MSDTNVDCPLAVVRCVMELANRPNDRTPPSLPWMQRQLGQTNRKDASSPSQRRSSRYLRNCQERLKVAIFADKFCGPEPLPPLTMAKHEVQKVGPISFINLKSRSGNWTKPRYGLKALLKVPAFARKDCRGEPRTPGHRGLQQHSKSPIKQVGHSVN